MLLVFVALVDYMAGAELKISIFYLLPISLMIWFVNRRIGVIFAILSSTLEVMTDLMVGHPYSHPIIVFWNGAVQAVFFVIIVLTLSALRRGYEKTLKINARVKVALFLGILVIAELMFFLYLGSSFFKLFSHLGQLHTFTFQMVIYVGIA